MSARNISPSNQFQSNTTSINTVHPSTLLLSTATNASNSVQLSEQSGLAQGVRSQPPLAVRVLSTGNSQSASQLLQKPRTQFSSTGVAQVINGPLNTKILSGNAETKLLIHKPPTVNQSTGPNLLPLNTINNTPSASADPAKLVSTANLIPISATSSTSRISAANPLGLIYATPAPNVLNTSINPQSAGSVLIGSNNGKTLVTLPSMGPKGLATSAPVATLMKPTVIRGIPLAQASTLSTPAATPPTTKSSSGNDSSTAGNSPGNETPNTTPGRAHSPSQSSMAVNRKRSRKQALSHHQPSEQHSNSSTPPPSTLPCSPSPPPPASNASSRAVATANIFMMSNAAIMADKSKSEGDSLIKENGVSLVASSSSMIPLKLIPVRTGTPCTVTSTTSVQSLINTPVKSLAPHYTNGLFVVAHAQHPAAIIPTTSVESAQPADSVSTIILANSSTASSQPVVSISNLEAALSQNSAQSGIYQLKYRAGDVPTAQPSPSVAALLTPASDSSRTPITSAKIISSHETPTNQGQKSDNWHASGGSASTLSSSPTSSMHALNAAVSVLSRAAQERANRARYESMPRGKTERQYSSVSSSSSACESLEDSIVFPRAPAVQVVPQKPAYARFVKSGHFLKHSDVKLKTPGQSELGYAFSWLNEPSADDNATNGSSSMGPRRGGGDFNLRKRPVPSAMGQLINASRPAKAPRKAVMNYIQESGICPEPEEHSFPEESLPKRLDQQGLMNTAHSLASSQDALHVAPLLQGGACTFESYCMWHYLIELRDQHSVTQYVRNPLATTSSLDLTGWRLLHSANGLFQLYDSERSASLLAQTLEKSLSLMVSTGKGEQKGQSAQPRRLEEPARMKAEKTLEMVKALQQRNQLMLSKLEDFYKRSHGLVERHRFPTLQLFDDLGRLLEPLEQEPLDKHPTSVNGAISDILCEEAEMELETSPGMWPRLMHSMTYSESVASSCESTGLGSLKTMEVPVTEPPKDTSVLDDPLQRPNRRKEFITSSISSANISRTSSPTGNPLAAALISSRKIR
ncbi:hypothetical protein Ciccas_003997 [Cichlidogyrus casuarinus]|uniref:Uncharacterized protein n=1 Tax=Cichlidogyrus casuarinus TaxID=1844966 RepID=A0ABD2QCS3_9PLAT